MKKHIVGIFTVAVLAATMMPSIALAVEAETQAETTTTTSSTETTKSAETLKTELTARLEKRKTELKTKLTTAQKTVLKGKCKASQGKISSVGERAKGIETSRSKVYTNITDKLTALSIKLKAKNVDTTELDADIVTLQAKIKTFNTDFATYKQAVSDLSSMDCAADPDGFKSSLDAARAALETVKKDSTDIKTYVSDTIKPLLKTIRTTLEATESKEAN